MHNSLAAQSLVVRHDVCIKLKIVVRLLVVRIVLVFSVGCSVAVVRVSVASVDDSVVVTADWRSISNDVSTRVVGRFVLTSTMGSVNASVVASLVVSVVVSVKSVTSTIDDGVVVADVFVFDGFVVGPVGISLAVCVMLFSPTRGLLFGS